MGYLWRYKKKYSIWVLEMIFTWLSSTAETDEAILYTFLVSTYFLSCWNAYIVIQRTTEEILGAEKIYCCDRLKELKSV